MLAGWYNLSSILLSIKVKLCHSRLHVHFADETKKMLI